MTVSANQITGFKQSGKDLSILVGLGQSDRLKFF